MGINYVMPPVRKHLTKKGLGGFQAHPPAPGRAPGGRTVHHGIAVGANMAVEGETGWVGNRVEISEKKKPKIPRRGIKLQ